MSPRDGDIECGRGVYLGVGGMERIPQAYLFFFFGPWLQVGLLRVASGIDAAPTQNLVQPLSSVGTCCSPRYS